MVQESKIVVELETEAEYLDFLRSDRSMKCFGNSVDVAAISNMLNINIGVFTNGPREGQGGLGRESVLFLRIRKVSIQNLKLLLFLMKFLAKFIFP